jgi:hypothetical protein
MIGFVLRIEEKLFAVNSQGQNSPILESDRKLVSVDI